MNSAFMKTGDFCGTGFCFVVTRPTKRYKVFGRVGLGYRPRNNVVNVKLLALARKRPLQSPAFTTSIPIALANSLCCFLPITTALVVFGRAALPIRVFGARPSSYAGSDIAIVRTKAAGLSIKRFELFCAMFAGFCCRLFPAPSRFVVARHAAKAPCFRMIGEYFKDPSATFASFFNARARFAFTAGLALVPCWPAIRSGTTTGTVFSGCTSDKVLAAFDAVVMNWLHEENITRTRSKNKDFEIACKRVREAYAQPDMFVEQAKPSAPVQEGFDL